MITIFKDTFTIAAMRLRIIFKSLYVRIAFVTAIIITLFFVNTFLETAQENTSLMIGIIDNDNSERSKKLIDELALIPAIRVETGKYDELLNELLDTKIYTIIEIKEGFSENINNGIKRDLLKIYYLKGNSNMGIASDIILSKVMDELCYHACYNEFYDIAGEDTDVSFDDIHDKVYEKYSGSVKFSYDLINVSDDTEITDKVSNKLIYQLVLLGIITILISFIILFASNSLLADNIYNTAIRIRLSKISLISKVAGNILALFTTSQAYLMFSLLLLFKGMGITSLKDVLYVLFVLTLFNLTMVILFYIITCLVNEAVMLQIIGAFIVVACGIFGSFEMISVLVPDRLMKIAAFIPNVYVIKAYVASITGVADNMPVIMLSAFCITGLIIAVLAAFIKTVLQRNVTLEES